MEVTHIKEENKKLMKQISDQKGRLADLEARVSVVCLFKCSNVLQQLITFVMPNY
jgi:hypothetical protein